MTVVPRASRQRRLTAANHLLISSLVQSSGLPVGSAAAGNMSLPQMAQTLTAVTNPAKPKKSMYISDGISSDIVSAREVSLESNRVK
jgi:hypothetical protein